MIIVVNVTSRSRWRPCWPREPVTNSRSYSESGYGLNLNCPSRESVPAGLLARPFQMPSNETRSPSRDAGPARL
jgi:hypothetical protein